MEKLNEQQIEIIKKHKGNINPIDLERYQVGMNDTDYKELTGIDLKTLDRMYGETYVYGEVRYCKCGEHFEVQYTTMLKDSSNENLSGAFECEDFLGLFSTKQTEDIHEKLQELFENHFNEFEDFLKEKNYSRSEDLSGEYIKKETMTADDVPEELKEEIAEDWIIYNSESALDKAIDNASNSDIKTAIMCYLDNNL